MLNNWLILVDSVVGFCNKAKRWAKRIYSNYFAVFYEGFRGFFMTVACFSSEFSAKAHKGGPVIIRDSSKNGSKCRFRTARNTSAVFV